MDDTFTMKRKGDPLAFASLPVTSPALAASVHTKHRAPTNELSVAVISEQYDVTESPKSPAHLLVSVDEVQPMTGKLSYSRRS